MATAVSSVLKHTINEPIFTGALLYVLTRGSLSLRERLLQPFQHNLLANNGAARLASLILVLKVLTGAGVVKRINEALNTLAWNKWQLFGTPGTAFKFGPEKEELVIITGGSSGFGYEMVKGFSSHARVVALDISPFPPELAKLDGVHYYKCDLSDTSAIEQVCEEIRQAHGEATVLINNAGIGAGKTILETSNADSERLYKVNLTSYLVLIREFLPGMLRQKRGHVVTMASMASFVAAPGLVDYCVSKVGALYLTEGLRAECMTHYEGGEGICTTSVHPSWHQTGILKDAEAELAKRGIVADPPKNVSDVVVKQVLSGKSGRLCVPVSAGRVASLRSLPRWAQDVLQGYAWRRKDQFGLEKKTT